MPSPAAWPDQLFRPDSKNHAPLPCKVAFDWTLRVRQFAQVPQWSQIIRYAVGFTRVSEWPLSPWVRCRIPYKLQILQLIRMHSIMKSNRLSINTLAVLAALACLLLSSESLRILTNRNLPYSLYWSLGLLGCFRCSDEYSIAEYRRTTTGNVFLCAAVIQFNHSIL